MAATVVFSVSVSGSVFSVLSVLAALLLANVEAQGWSKRADANANAAAFLKDTRRPDAAVWTTLEDGSETLVEAYRVNLPFESSARCADSDCKLWVSLGNPSLQPVVASLDPDQLSIASFLFAPSGFSFSLQLLTDKQRTLLASKLSQKYTQNVDPSSILEMPLTDLWCNVTLVDQSQANVKYTYVGSVSDFSKRPYSVHFPFAGKSEAAVRVAGQLKDWNTPLLKLNESYEVAADQITCRAVYSRKSSYQNDSTANYLQFLSELPNENSSTTYMTKSQVNLLIDQVYELFGLNKSLALCPKDFRETAFAQLLASGALSQTTLDFSTAIQSLSPFGQLYCRSGFAAVACDSSLIAQELNKLVYLDERGKAYFHANNSEAVRNTGRLTNASYLGVISLGKYFGEQELLGQTGIQELPTRLNSLEASDVVWSVTQLQSFAKVRSLKVLAANVPKLNSTLLSFVAQVRDVVFKRDFAVTITRQALVGRALALKQTQAATAERFDVALNTLFPTLSEYYVDAADKNLGLSAFTPFTTSSWYASVSSYQFWCASLTHTAKALECETLTVSDRKMCGSFGTVGWSPRYNSSSGGTWNPDYLSLCNRVFTSGSTYSGFSAAQVELTSGSTESYFCPRSSGWSTVQDSFYVKKLRCLF